MRIQRKQPKLVLAARAAIATESVRSGTTEGASRSTEPARRSLSAATEAETAQIKSSNPEKKIEDAVTLPTSAFRLDDLRHCDNSSPKSGRR
jgi:hypothetical protein